MQRFPARTIHKSLSLIGLILLGMFIITQPRQAQTASVENPEVREQISKSVGNFKLTVPSLENAAKSGNPTPAGATPQPGISGLSDRLISRDRNAPRRYEL